MPLLRRLAVAASTLALVGGLSACDAVSDLVKPETGSSAVTPSATPTYDSQFTRDGTFQSHVKVDGIDYVYTIWPTKSTPRTNLWFPKGDKFFSFTFQAYDLDRKLRDSFASKRRVYLKRIEVDSQTQTSSGNSESPYTLDEDARDVTFDPEPVGKKKYGMLVTSPKGAFELRNQRIGTIAADTKGLVLTFRATVYAETEAKSGEYDREEISQKVPIAIFASGAETQAQKIPFNAN